MTDHDVGKIWASVLTGGMKSPEDAEVVKGLIRKLVEERRKTYLDDLGSCYPKSTIEATLYDFNIDPATWTKD